MKKTILLTVLWTVQGWGITNLHQLSQEGVGTKTILTDSHHQTVYVFDPDLNSKKPSCNGKCAEVWPPLTVSTEEAQRISLLNPKLSVQTRDSGLLQVIYQGRPLYLFHQDRVAGDIKGDGLGGVWHIVQIKTQE